jgi:hypothetical protein
MAHFAKINSNKVIEQVIVISNDDITVNGQESEQKGKDFIANVLNLEGDWVQTSYNANFRGKYAGIGDTWDGTNFIAPVVEETIFEEEVPE